MKRINLPLFLMLSAIVLAAGICGLPASNNGGNNGGNVSANPTAIGNVIKINAQVQAGPTQSMQVVDNSAALNSQDTIHVSGGKGRARVTLVNGSVVIEVYNNSTASTSVSGAVDAVSFLQQGGLRTSVTQGATNTVNVPGGGQFKILGTEAFMIYDPETGIASAGNFHGEVLFTAPGGTQQPLSEHTIRDIFPDGKMSPEYPFDPAVLTVDKFDEYMSAVEDPVDGMNNMRRELNIPLSASQNSAPTAVPTNPAPVKVTLWHGFTSGSPEEVALSQLAAQANKDLAADGITISMVQVSFGDLLTKYRAEVAAGSGPDMIMFPNYSLGDDVRAGVFADITDLTAGKLDGYTPKAVESMSLNGRVYGVPESQSVMALYYNTNTLSSPPATVTDLTNLFQGGDFPVSISFGCFLHWGFYGAFGGRVFDDNWKVAADQSQGMLDAYTYLNQIYQLSLKRGWPTDVKDADSAFRVGKIVLMSNGNWVLTQYKAALGDKLGVAPLPAGPGGPATPLLDLDGFYVNPISPSQGAAVTVALYLTSAASQIALMNAADLIPSRNDISINDPLIQAFYNAAAEGFVRPQVPQISQYWANFCGDSAIFQQGVSPLEFLKNATIQSNK